MYPPPFLSSRPRFVRTQVHPQVRGLRAVIWRAVAQGSSGRHCHYVVGKFDYGIGSASHGATGRMLWGGIHIGACLIAPERGDQQPARPFAPLREAAASSRRRLLARQRFERPLHGPGWPGTTSHQHTALNIRKRCRSKGRPLYVGRPTPKNRADVVLIFMGWFLNLLGGGAKKGCALGHLSAPAMTASPARRPAAGTPVACHKRSQDRKVLLVDPHP